jgi:hypothetical protein
MRCSGGFIDGRGHQLYLNFQSIPERMHGEQMPRLARNIFDLLTQLHDQLIESARGTVVGDAPDFVQERFTRNGIANFQARNLDRFKRSSSD